MRGSRLAIQIEAYLEELKGRGLTKDTIKKHYYILKKFCAFAESERVYCVRRVKLDMAKRFFSGLAGYSASHQRMSVVVIRGFLSYHKNPVLAGYRPRIYGTQRKNVDWLNMEDCENLFMMELSPLEAVMIGGGLLQGLRRAEICRLTISDVHTALKTGIISIRGKCAPREIPLHPDYFDILRRYVMTLRKPANSYLVELSAMQYYQAIVAISERFGKKFRSHTLRRTCGRLLWLKGVKIETISKILGHATINQTVAYLGLNLADMSGAISQLIFIKKPIGTNSLAR